MAPVDIDHEGLILEALRAVFEGWDPREEAGGQGLCTALLGCLFFVHPFAL